jgi:hypothetical protein
MTPKMNRFKAKANKIKNKKPVETFFFFEKKKKKKN